MRSPRRRGANDRDHTIAFVVLARITGHGAARVDGIGAGRAAGAVVLIDLVDQIVGVADDVNSVL
jgi:hypothetical protein